MTTLEIIEETVAYYAADPKRRAVTENGGCDYITDDGRMCAFGRCEINPIQHSQGIGARFDNDEQIENVLKPEYRGQDPYFWRSLQALHDESNNWDETGLTKGGQKEVEKLKATFCHEPSGRENEV